MRKLFLTTSGIPAPNLLTQLLGKKPEDVRIAIIPNAKDHYSVTIKKQKVLQSTIQLSSLGYRTEIVDLRKTVGHKKIIRVLQTYDAVWVEGGNSFYLRSAMRSSGFDTAIATMMDKGLVYCGESAGAVVAGLSLEAVEAVDDPSGVDTIIMDGLGLAPYYFLPHADSPLYTKGVTIIRDIVSGRYRLVEITDHGTVMIVDDMIMYMNGQFTMPKST